MKNSCGAKNQEIINNIRKIRVNKNYTQRFMASKLNISQHAYSKLELGYYDISLEKVFFIAEVLEIGVLDLFSISVEELGHSDSEMDKGES